ncbi:cytidylate kinase family protein [Coprococcus catus]|uniref:Cytidylate kinase family protein n=1 Tax=Coprococcus catus TaxID=116085 RepID=A0A3E2TLK9_9FIRM|nr:cytidylate kinase family protein [Coprococcus catus]RGB78555.1 cytidylate kinase family protein [Coprococcus catus]
MNKLKRYIIFLVGLFVNSLGVSLITKANLGTSPISSIPYVLSLNFPLTLGNFTIIFSILLIILQLFILRKNFKLEHLLQIPISILFGYFIDLTMLLFSFVNPTAYIAKLIYLLIGCVILGFGVYMEVLADVAMLPGESFVRAIVQTWHREFGSTKVCFDVSMAVIAAALSFILAHRLDGVREGTVIAALLVGFLARQFGRLLAFVKPMLFPEDYKTSEEKVDQTTPASNNSDYVSVITIGRQYGSGGSELGQILADKLGYAFYDKEIIEMTAGTTGYSSNYVGEHQESLTNSLIYDLVNHMYTFPETESPKDKIFDAQSKVIKEIAEKGHCVIVGRCADQILKDRTDCLNIFLHAPLKNRIKRVMGKKNLTEKDAKQLILREERRRADNYHYYTRQIWGASANYHLSLDTSLGYDYVLDVIMQTAKKMK